MTKEFKPGDRVMYKSGGPELPEYGIVSSTNLGTVVFVHYYPDSGVLSKSTKATNKDDLFLAECEGMKDDIVLVVDIETTGFNKELDSIVEIGIVSLNVNTGERKVVFDKQVREQNACRHRFQKSWIVNNSTMSVGDFAQNSIEFEQVRDEIHALLKNNAVTAFNRAFDIPWLESRGFQFGGLAPCPMLVSTDIVKIPKKRGFGYKWPKVQEAYDFFFPGNDYVEEHRGCDDAWHEAEIVFELIKRGEYFGR